jgi:KaiC/GvpD/RAD55 family RecA-like ATPase
MEVGLMADRVRIGIPGLDPLIQGGLQRGDFVLLVGGVGTGKTIFCSHFVYNGAKLYGENAVYASFEEDLVSLRRNMRKFGMDFEELESQGKVKLLDLEALQGRGIGANVETILAALDEVKGKRLVIDSLTAFLSGVGEKFDYSFLMHLVYKTLKREGITSLLTVSRAQGTRGDVGLEEFVADGVFELENYVTPQGEMRTRFVIRKLRGTNHSRSYHHVAFGPSGLEIIPYSL